jgi:hypothetical protein
LKKREEELLKLLLFFFEKRVEGLVKTGRERIKQKIYWVIKIKSGCTVNKITVLEIHNGL